MDKSDIYKELEKEFLSTFIGELIPGVLHNFANPLNGIMGRSKLLQRRFEQSSRDMEKRYPGLAQEPGQDKIAGDINTIVAETDRFFTIFRGLAGKFSVLSSSETERINLSQLIEAEISFADFYLDFKHEFKKNLQLDGNLPEIIGNPADYSLCISALLRSSKERMKDCPVKEILISTSHDASCISLTIQDGGMAISDVCRRLAQELEPALDIDSLPESDRGIYYAFLLLKRNGVRMQVNCEEGRNNVSLNIPYR